MLIALVVVSAIAVFLFIRAFKLSMANLELSEIVLQQHKELDESHDVVKESFLKFVSDSREWAFEYIEEVQIGLQNFVNKVDHDINYFDQYGEVIWTPLTPAMKNISEAYKDLKTLLPKDDNAQA